MCTGIECAQGRQFVAEALSFVGVAPRLVCSGFNTLVECFGGGIAMRRNTGSSGGAIAQHIHLWRRGATIFIDAMRIAMDASIATTREHLDE